MGVTVGTLTIAINSLVKKQYATRVRSEDDRRVVLISLTAKGRKAYQHHKKFHEKMVQATVAGLKEDEKEILVHSLQNLSKFFRNYEN